jgi:iron complex transport system substrate-binding protein
VTFADGIVSRCVAKAADLWVWGALLVVLAVVWPTRAQPALPAGGRRIVSLAPSVTETLFALGAGGEVVGVSQYDDYPPAVKGLPRVGSFLTPNIEQIAALRPTLVIGLGSSANLREIHALGAMGYPTLMVDDDTVEEIERSIDLIGQRIGRAAQASALLAKINSRLEAVRARLAGMPARRVLMVVGHQPMVAVGQGTYLDELLKMAHADNIADRTNQAWPRLSMEYIIAMRPQVILDGEMGNDPTAPSGFWNYYPTIPAVKTHHIYGYPRDPTLRPGPRIAATLELLAALIHPQAFKTVSLRAKPAHRHGDAR